MLVIVQQYYMIKSCFGIISQIIQASQTVNLKLTSRLSSNKKQLPKLFKTEKTQGSNIADIPTKKSIIIDSIKQKIHKRLAINPNIIVPTPQRYQNHTNNQAEQTTNNNKATAAEATIRQKNPNCKTQQYKTLMKNLSKQQVRAQIMYCWESIKSRGKSESSKQQKTFHDIAQRRYIELLKEQLRRGIIQQQKQPLQVDFRNLRALLFIDEHVQGLYGVIGRSMKQRSIQSKKVIFITGMGNSDGLQSSLARQLQIWCFEKRYFGYLSYQKVVDPVKNYSGYLIDFRVKLQ